MSKKTTTIVGDPAIDPTMPDVTITLKGETYHLCFTYGALAIAERKLSDAGQRVNLLQAIDLNAERLPYAFYASLVTAHPDMTFEDASKLLTMKSYPEIYSGVIDAFTASMAEPEDKAQNPTVEPAAA